MYSFFYDASETWAVWPNQIGLTEFTEDRSEIIIAQIFLYFFDGVRDALTEVEDSIVDQKTALLIAIGELEKALGDYQTSVTVGDDFVR